MRHKLILALVVYNLMGLIGFSQIYSFVKVLPGKGIIFNNDSIILGKTNIKETCKILKVKYYNNDILLLSTWDGYDPVTLQDTSGTEFIRKVNFKTINCEFASDNDENNLKLRWIEIKEDKSLKIYTSEGIEMGEINPKISEIYPIVNKHDYISDDKLTFNLYSYGVSFQLDKSSSGDLKVVEISTHFKWE